MSETVKPDSALAMYNMLVPIMALPQEEALQALEAAFTESERVQPVFRVKINQEITERLRTQGGASFPAIAKQFGCSKSLVRHIWRDIRDENPPTDKPANFRLAIPKETRAQDLVEELLIERGFTININKQGDHLVDSRNEISPIPLSVIRGADIPVHLKVGAANLAFLGEDKIRENAALARLKKRKPVKLDIRQVFCENAFRMCLAIPKGEQEKATAQGISYFNEKTVATSYPATLKEHFRKNNVTARVFTLAGGVEGAVKALAALKIQAIMDVVETGDSLEKAGLVAFGNPQARFGEPLYAGNMSLIGLKGAERPAAEQQIWQRFTTRLDASSRLAA